jgi:hypothetical protein
LVFKIAPENLSWLWYSRYYWTIGCIRWWLCVLDNLWAGAVSLVGSDKERVLLGLNCVNLFGLGLYQLISVWLMFDEGLVGLIVIYWTLCFSRYCIVWLDQLALYLALFIKCWRFYSLIQMVTERYYLWWRLAGIWYVTLFLM